MTDKDKKNSNWTDLWLKLESEIAKQILFSQDEEKNKDLTVFLNQKKINLNLNKDMLIFGKKNICRPKNLNHFLVNINKYMRLNDRFI